MKLFFVGCGAADYDWSRYGESGILGSTMSLLNDSILLDCGPTAMAALKRFGIDPRQITAVVNTHSHGDHLNIEQLRMLAGERNIDFFGSKEACAKVAGFCNVHPLTFGDEFEIGTCRFLTLPSNHAVEDIREETFNYLISDSDGKTLLYALDTAWMLTKARLLIGKRYLNAVVWDGTMSEADNWRIFEHSDPVMLAAMRRVLTQTGNIDENTKVYLSHRALTLWPQDIQAQEEIARREKVLLAQEGESLIL